ncbi:hypothetical protein AB0F30_15710 [Streptomyces sp. NPDC029006]|uniref:hypothetical protein n=1 Tax=Streptomyces sp. NPDC029006 TaxID=3155467 RepID=UPI0034004B10
MLIQFVTAIGVLAALTMVPGPDMAVVTKRAVASGWRDGLRTVGGNWLGARVVTYLGPERNGGYATYTVASADALHHVPDGVADATAVAMIGTGRTAVGVGRRLHVGRLGTTPR